MSEFRHTRLISEYDSVTGKFINYLELGDTSTDPDTPVDLRFRVPGYIENVHTIYFEGDHGDSPEAGISTSKPSGIVHDLVFFDPQNTSGKTLSELVAGSGTGLWQDTGTYAELIAAEDITMQSKNITGINGITMDSEKDGINMSDSPISNVGGITMSDAINMGGNGITGASVIKAVHLAGVEFRPSDYVASGDELLNIAYNGFAFIAGANASMDGNDISLVKAINGTTTTPLQLNFCGNDPATHEIWREGDDLKFKDATATGTKTLSELASSGGSSTFTGLSDTPPNYTDHAGEFVKVKSDLSGLEFVAGGSGESLWESSADNVTYLTTPEDVDIAGYSITNLSAINATDMLEGYDELHIRSQSGTLDVAMFQALSDDSGGLLDMKSHHIANVLDGDDVAHAVNLGQLGYVDPTGWVDGDILYASGSNTLVRLAKGNDAQVLTLSSGVPTWADPSGSGFTCVNLNSCHVTDLTDVSSAGSHNIITDAERTKLNGIDTSLYMLLSVYDPGSDGVVIPTAGGTGLGSGLNAYETGDILYASAADTLGRLVHGEENQVLTMNSSLLPVWATPSGGTGLWQDMGTYVQLIQSDNDLSMRNKSILSCPSVKVDGTDSYIDIRGGSAYPARVIAYGEGAGHPGQVRLYVPNAAKNDWVLGLAVSGATDAPIVTIPHGLDMVGNTIDDADVIKANDSFGVKFKQYDTDDIRLYVAWSGYAFIANANANMNTHDIINIGTIKGVSTHDLKFYDDVLCTDGNPVTLSHLANGGLWEEVNTSTIRPKTGYTTIQGIDSNDLYIKPASGQILYLG